MSTKGSCAEADTNPLGKDPSDVHVNTIGLYVLIDQSTQLVALEKVYDSSSTILIINMCNNIWLTIFMSNVSNRFRVLGNGVFFSYLIITIWVCVVNTHGNSMHFVMGCFGVFSCW